MKKALIFLAFIISSSFLLAQDAETIVAKHLATTGADNWLAINTIKIEAQINTDAAAGMTILYTMAAVREKACRIDVAIMGMTQTTAINGNSGWSTNPFTGKLAPEPLTNDQVKSMADMTDIDGTLVGYKEKGYTLEYMGTENVEGIEAIKIKLNKVEKTEYHFFDPETYYEIKLVIVDEVDGKKLENSSLFSNFKTQNGIVLPFTTKQVNDFLGNSTITYTTITFNPMVDEAMFEMTKK